MFAVSTTSVTQGTNYAGTNLSSPLINLAGCSNSLSVIYGFGSALSGTWKWLSSTNTNTYNFGLICRVS
jgi:hypothetical protein